MKPKFYSSDKHKIKEENIDPEALNVIKKLRKAGHLAYLVGGSVRDLLINVTPKDFDISTSAKPEEIKHIFRNCLLIGRRFRLAHIRFGRNVLEVSTFRSGDIENSELIIRDNQWGSPEEDVLRRDFTINGMFYDPVKNEVIDYVNGWHDIKKKLLRSIGVPQDRFIQDPVRMIRLLKFQARLGFSIDPETINALHKCREEILKSSPARVLEETFKMLESGFSKPFFELMVNSGIMKYLYPALDHFLKGQYAKDIYKYLEIADKLYHENNKSFLDRAVLTSCLVFPILQREIEYQFIKKDAPPSLGDLFFLSHTLIKGFVTTSFPHFPRRLRTALNFIIDAQFRLIPIPHNRMKREKILFHEDFPLALEFLKIRSMANEELIESYSIWKQQYKQHAKRNGSIKKNTISQPKRKTHNKRID